MQIGNAYLAQKGHNKGIDHMADTTEVLLRTIEEEWAQARQSENQRANITYLVVLIAAAIQGLFAQTGFGKNALPLTILLVVLGVYGAVASAKLYERFKFHHDRIRKLRIKIDEICQINTNQIIYDADEEHMKRWQQWEDQHKFGCLFNLSKFRLNRIWLMLHIFIVILGIVETVISSVR